MHRLNGPRRWFADRLANRLAGPLADWLAERRAQPSSRPATASSRSTSTPTNGARPDGDERRRVSARLPRPRSRHGAFSVAAMQRAWRKVEANGGGAGVDGVDIASFAERLDEELDVLARELGSGTYRPRPVRRIFVPKSGVGLRPLAMWTLRDRVAQRAVYDLLEPLFDPQFLPCSHGFRPGRSVETAVRAVIKARDAGNGWVVDADIKDCFDSLDSAIVLKLVRQRVKDRRLIELIRRWLDVRVLDAHGRMVAAGAAQGGPLSPLLCNVYLHAFDEAMARRRIPLVRYADDFVCFAPRRADAEAALQAAAAELATLKLELNPFKTRLVHFDEGFKFLGYFFVRREHYPL